MKITGMSSRGVEMDNRYVGEVWCVDPDYSWHMHFLPVQTPTCQPTAPSESSHEHETGE